VADEVPPEGVAVPRLLRLQVLETVLADDLNPGVGQGGHVVHRDVLRGDDDGDIRPDLVSQNLIAFADGFR